MQTGEGKNLKANFINAMQAKILSGELKPGDRLPPERELAQQMGISRGSVNQGILDMGAHGLSAHRAAQRAPFVAGIRAPRHAGDAVGDNEL